MSVTLPGDAMFDATHHLFVTLSVRQATVHADDGYVLLKIYNGTPVPIQKMGMANVTNFAYNPTTKVLTFTSPSYASCNVIGGVQ